MSNPTNKYQTPVGLQQPAAADLSDGTTGTGAVVQAGSPTLTGSPIAPTQASSDSSTKLATTAFVATAVANALAGVNPAVAVQAASAAILPNTPTYNNGVTGIGATITAGVTNTALVVDGYTPILNDRILVKNESGGGGLGAGKNGVYFVSQIASLGLAWILTRALDYDQPSDINNTGAIPVVNGTANAITQWVLTSSITAVDGTQALTYAEFSVNPATLAPLASPAFTGTPTAPTAAVSTNTTQLATTAFVLANSSTIDTLNVNSSVVVTPFSFSALVNGIGPVGEVTVNAFPVANYKPCMVETSANMTAQRLANVIYQNTSRYPIYVSAWIFGMTVNTSVTAVSDSSTVPTTVVFSHTTCNTAADDCTPVFFVMPGNYYKISTTGTTTVNVWREFICQNGTMTDSGDLVGSKALSTVYHNTSTNTMFVVAQCTGTSAAGLVQGISDDSPSPTNVIDAFQQTSSGTGLSTVFFIVPAGHYYKVTAASGSLAHWHEYSWNIPCTKSGDLISGPSFFRTGAGLTTPVGTGAAYVTATVPQYWTNTDPFRVRWVSILTTNSAALGRCGLWSDEGTPPFLPLAYAVQLTAGTIRNLRGPIMPNKHYMFLDNFATAGTLTQNHWWEYQLG